MDHLLTKALNQIHREMDFTGFNPFEAGHSYPKIDWILMDHRLSSYYSSDLQEVSWIRFHFFLDFEQHFMEKSFLFNHQIQTGTSKVAGINLVITAATSYRKAFVVVVLASNLQRLQGEKQIILVAQSKPWASLQYQNPRVELLFAFDLQALSVLDLSTLDGLPYLLFA
jgi:hypothetical protein